MELGPGEDSQALGAGVLARREWSGIFPTSAWGNEDGYVLETTGDRHRIDGSNTCEVSAIRRRRVKTVWTDEDEERAQWDLAKIYTDGSLKVTGNFLMRAQTGGTRVAAASVVMDNGDGTYDAVRATSGIKLRSAYDAELLGLALAGWASTTSTVHCDCESAIRAVKGFHQNGRGDARQSAALWATRPGNEIRKVRAHAERRGGPATEEERGNCVADAVAKGERQANVDVLELDEEDVRKIFRSLEFLLATDEDADPDWRKLRQIHRGEAYLRQRDQYRTERGQPARWEGTTLHLAGAIVRRAGTMLQRARFVRTIWDKQAHGGNTVKWGLTDEDGGRCGTCGALEDQRHIVMDCGNPGMQEARAGMFAALRQGCESVKSASARRILLKMEDLVMHHPHGHTVLTGVLTPEIQEEIRGIDVDLSDRDYRAVVEVIAEVYHWVDKIYLCRARQGTEMRREQREETRLRRRKKRQRQTTIEEYTYRRAGWREEEAQALETRMKEDDAEDERRERQAQDTGDDTGSEAGIVTGGPRNGLPPLREEEGQARAAETRQRNSGGRQRRMEDFTGRMGRVTAESDGMLAEGRGRHGDGIGERGELVRRRVADVGRLTGKRGRSGSRRLGNGNGSRKRRRSRRKGDEHPRTDGRGRSEREERDDGGPSGAAEADYERAMERPHDNRRWDQ